MEIIKPVQSPRAEIVKNKREPKMLPVKHEVVKVYVWELPVRVFHWLNALAIVLLIVTGIYIGNPFLSSTVPEEAYYSYVMGWVRYIHFFAAFVFTLNLLVRLYWSIKGNKFTTVHPFKSAFWKGMFETIKYYLFMKNNKQHYIGHNPLAQLSYLIIIGLGSIVMVLTGFYLYAEPQPESVLGKMFSWVPVLFGDTSFSIRSMHHVVAWLFVIFIVVHIYMAIRDDWMQRNGTLSSIITGYKTEPRDVLNDGEKHD
nr:Ni/Fe-hydrogenase, b-type cytochrome subunit [uncultured Bacillus sp.]